MHPSAGRRATHGICLQVRVRRRPNETVSKASVRRAGTSTITSFGSRLEDLTLCQPGKESSSKQQVSVRVAR